jgi:hypothetical protein
MCGGGVCVSVSAVVDDDVRGAGVFLRIGMRFHIQGFSYYFYRLHICWYCFTVACRRYETVAVSHWKIKIVAG